MSLSDPYTDQQSFDHGTSITLPKIYVTEHDFTVIFGSFYQPSLDEYTLQITDAPNKVRSINHRMMNNMPLITNASNANASNMVHPINHYRQMLIQQHRRGEPELQDRSYKCTQTWTECTYLVHDIIRDIKFCTTCTTLHYQKIISINCASQLCQQPALFLYKLEVCLLFLLKSH